MKTSELDYQLPNELIAQEPVEPRDSSRLLVLDRQSGLIEHRQFREAGDYLRPGDLLVVNDTKVLPARLIGKKQGTGAKVEFLLLIEITTQKNNRGHPFEKGMSPRPIRARNDNTVWEVLAKPAKRLQPGSIITFDPDLTAEVIEELENGRRLVKFHSEEPLLNMVQKVGKMPLPPYIVKPLLHPERYQTIYAQKQESAAAPTAGLHFTPNLIEKLKNKGIKFAHLTLRIGLDTFQPIREQQIENHHIHSEYYEVGEEAAKLLNEAREKEQRIIAVGTTSARVLETLEILPACRQARRCAQDDKSTCHSEAKGRRISGTMGYTDLFIYPGYKFKSVDLMLTNFHLPKSTLLAMVGAFAGLDKIKMAYSEAINNKYRFFSFGDAMLII